jgi:hypothetical protein
MFLGYELRMTRHKLIYKIIRAMRENIRSRIVLTVTLTTLSLNTELMTIFSIPYNVFKISVRWASGVNINRKFKP